jgi:hypothetical protein
MATARFAGSAESLGRGLEHHAGATRVRLAVAPVGAQFLEVDRLDPTLLAGRALDELVSVMALSERVEFRREDRLGLSTTRTAL